MESHLPKQTIKASTVILISFVVDFLDVILSLIVAILSGSVIMTTQVLEGVADLISSGFLMIGLERSRKRSNHTHPFGYGREIYFWTLISALVMFGISSTLSFYLGLQRFLMPEKLQEIPLALGVLLFTLVTNGYAFILSLQRLLWKRSPAQIIKIFYRSSLVETKTTFILDLMGTFASLLGIIALIVYKITGNYRLDGLGAMIIGISMAIFAYLLILGIRDLLIGKSAPLEVEDRIREVAKNIPNVQDILGIRTMHIGSEKLLVNLDVHLNARLTTNEIETLIDTIKDQVRKEVPTAKHIQVELETPH